MVAWSSAISSRESQDNYEIGQASSRRKNLEGSVRRSGTNSGSWSRSSILPSAIGISSETYDRVYADLDLLWQGEIAGAIVNVSDAAGPTAQGGAAGAQHFGSRSLQLVPERAYFWYERISRGLRRVEEMFPGSHRAGQQLRPAYAGSPMPEIMSGYGIEHPVSVLPRARAWAAFRAFGDRFPTLGKRTRRSDRSVRFTITSGRKRTETTCRAIELNPGYATARFWVRRRFSHLTAEHVFDEAHDELKLACELRSPHANCQNVPGLSPVRFQGRYQDATVAYRLLLEEEPTSTNSIPPWAAR